VIIFTKRQNFKVAITNIYPRIPWDPRCILREPLYYRVKHFL